MASGHYKTINRQELYFHKYNQNGQINWIYRTNHDSLFSSSIKSMIELSNGDLIGVGQIKHDNQPKILVIKLSSSGQFQWSSYFNHDIEGNKIILLFGITKEELINLESEYLKKINWELYVTEDEFYYNVRRFDSIHQKLIDDNSIYKTKKDRYLFIIQSEMEKLISKNIFCCV